MKKSNDDMRGLDLALVLVVVVLVLIFLIRWTTEKRYENCMRLKHDDVECQLYSHSR